MEGSEEELSGHPLKSLHTYEHAQETIYWTRDASIEAW